MKVTARDRAGQVIRRVISPGLNARYAARSAAYLDHTQVIVWALRRGIMRVTLPLPRGQLVGVPEAPTIMVR